MTMFIIVSGVPERSFLQWSGDVNDEADFVMTENSAALYDLLVGAGVSPQVFEQVRDPTSPLFDTTGSR